MLHFPSGQLEQNYVVVISPITLCYINKNRTGEIEIGHRAEINWPKKFLEEFFVGERGQCTQLKDIGKAFPLTCPNNLLVH